MKAKLLISLFVLTGFFIFAQGGTTIVDSFYVGGKYRSYRIYKPAVYTGTSPVPLVLNFHGYTSNAMQQQYYGNFMPIADTADFIVVHPQGTNDPVYNTPYWNAGLYSTGVNDLQFISQLIDTIKATFNIDPNSVYSTGLSNGGFMSNYLTCNLSNKIAAIASVAGTMFTGWYGTCSPGRPVPVMHIHGNADGTVPYNGGSGMIAADTLVKYWVTNTGSNPTPSVINLPNTNPSDGCTATHYVYAGGVDGSSVEFYKINGGGHTWPGATFSVGVTCMDFDASTEIWRFFRKYKLNVLTSVNELVKDNAVYVYPNPVQNTLYINLDESFSADLYDGFGKQVLSIKNEKQINLGGFSSGLYVLKISSGGQNYYRKIIRE